MSTSVSQVVIETVTPAMWRRYRAIRLRALAEEQNIFSGDFGQEANWTEQEWRQKAQEAQVYIARAHDIDAGLLRISDYEGELWASSVWVDPTCRGLSISTLLLDGAVEYASAQGATKLNLGVYAINPVSVEIFQSYGFIKTGELRKSGKCEGGCSSGCGGDWHHLVYDITPI